jgi:transcriptional regulator with XRE-family HTH domain
MKSIHEPAYRRLVAELRRAREREGLTQTEVGRLVGRGRNWVHKVETCEIRLDVLQFVRLCRACGLKAYELVRGLEEAP